MEKLLNIKDVEDRLNIPRSTLRSWVFQRKLPVLRVGRLVRFRESDLERWLKDQEVRK